MRECGDFTQPSIMAFIEIAFHDDLRGLIALWLRHLSNEIGMGEEKLGVVDFIQIITVVRCQPLRGTSRGESENDSVGLLVSYSRLPVT